MMVEEHNLEEVKILMMVTVKKEKMTTKKMMENKMTVRKTMANRMTENKMMARKMTEIH